MRRDHKDIQNKKFIKIIKEEEKLRNKDRGERTYYRKNGIERTYRVSTRFKKTPSI